MLITHSAFSRIHVSKVKSTKANTQYSAIAKNRGTDKTLYWAAEPKSSLKTEMNPLVSPQPGHLNPNSLYTGQTEPSKARVTTYRTEKYANPAKIDCRVCFFF